MPGHRSQDRRLGGLLQRREFIARLGAKRARLEATVLQRNAVTLCRPYTWYASVKPRARSSASYQRACLSVLLLGSGAATEHPCGTHTSTIVRATDDDDAAIAGHRDRRYGHRAGANQPFVLRPVIATPRKR